MVLRLCGEQTDLVDVPAGLRTQLSEQCKKFDGGAYVYLISVLEELRRSVKSSGSGRALVEAAIVRMAEAANFSSIESLLAHVEGDAPASRSPTASPSTPPRAHTPPPAAPKISTPPVSTGPSRASPPPAPPAKKRNPVASSGEEPTAPMSKRMTQADLKAANAEPMVKAAIEVFGGQIVHIQREGPEALSPAPSPEN